MKQQELFEIQSRVAELQLATDNAHSEIQEINATLLTLSNRQAELAAERTRQVEPSAAENVELSGVAHAQRCVDDILAGANNFHNELPQVQVLFQDLI